MAKVLTKENADKIMFELETSGHEAQVSRSELEKVIGRVLQTPVPSTVALMMRGLGNMGYIQPIGPNIFKIVGKRKQKVIN